MSTNDNDIFFAKDSQTCIYSSDLAVYSRASNISGWAGPARTHWAFEMNWAGFGRLRSIYLAQNDRAGLDCAFRTFYHFQATWPCPKFNWVYFSDAQPGPKPGLAHFATPSLFHDFCNKDKINITYLV